MKKVLLILVIAFLALVSLKVEAQNAGAPEVMKGKVLWCGGIGFPYYSFKNNSFYFGLFPQVGYRLTRSLEVGTRLGYQYQHQKVNNIFYSASATAHYFSGALYANYEFFRGLYVHVEDEEMRALYRGNGVILPPSSWYNNFFVGGGYRYYFSETGFVFFNLLYNLLWDKMSGNPYTSPLRFSVGFYKGLKE